MSIGKRLREFGLQEFRQLKLLANELGIAPSNLQKILKDERELTSSALLKLETLGCDLKWLLSGKRNLFHIDHDMWLRIEIIMSDVSEKFKIHKREINIDKIKAGLAKQPKELITEKVQAEKLYFTWIVHNDLSIIEIFELSELMNVDIQWLLTGKQNTNQQFKNAFLFNYPELALLLELRKNPDLFRKVKLYVDSEVSNISTQELSEVKDKINFIEEKYSKS